MWQWLKSKKTKQREADYKEQCRRRDEFERKAREELLAFRNVGEKFDFLGLRMIVKSHDCCSGYLSLGIHALYVDKTDKIIDQFFDYNELPMLIAENP